MANILSAHGRVVAVDENLELTHLPLREPSSPGKHLAELDDVSDGGLITSGAMSGFELIRNESGVSFQKDGFFLSADPRREKLELDRKSVREWETFQIVSNSRLQDIARFPQSPEFEKARFAATVAKLVAEGEPVKIFAGCGPAPRPGFLNLDIVVMAPGFAVTNYDEFFIFPYADEGWAIPDDCVDYIFHEDFIEHISQLQQIQFLAEAWRVLKPGAYHRVNTPSLIASMRRHSNFKAGMAGVYTGELQWGHVCIFTHASLKEMAEMIGYREVIFTTRHHGVSPLAEHDHRPLSDRDDIVGNIYADLQK
jgi:hypothetical protein